MTMISIRIPDDLKERMRAVNISWSAVVRDAIEAKLRQIERQRVLAGLHDGTAGVPPAPAGTSVAAIREDRDGR